MFNSLIGEPLAQFRRSSWNGEAERDTTQAVSHKISQRLHQAIPLFGGGGISTLALAITMAVEIGGWMLIAWAVIELALTGWRLAETWRARVASATEKSSAWRIASTIELFGAASVGFGSLAAISAGGALGLFVGWIMAVAFTGESCVRNIGNMRLTPAMVTLAAGPAVAMLIAAEAPLMKAAGALTALFVVRMIYGATRLNGLLIDTVRAERESDHRARHDTLTGLLNRAGLERELELMRRDHPRNNFTLYYIDLDRFKRVNDQNGHNAGDLLLRKVAQCLLSLVGAGDIVARIGGDEFIVVTVLTHVVPAEFGSALQMAIEALERPSSGAGVTASIGLAQTQTYGDDLTQLLEAADARLYRAKHAGGNRCVAE